MSFRGGKERMPGYLMIEKLQREKMKSRAEKRSLEFEKRLREREGSMWAQ